MSADNTSGMNQHSALDDLAQSGPDTTPHSEYEVTEFGALESHSRIYRTIVGIEGTVAVLFMIGVFAMVLLQVFTRYVLNSPLSWTEEIARLLMVWLTFTSAVFVAGRREHLAVDVVVNALPTRWGRYIYGFATVASAVAAAVLAVGGFTMTVLVLKLSLPASSLPSGLLYSAALVGFAGVFIHAVINFVHFLRHPELYDLNGAQP